MLPSTVDFLVGVWEMERRRRLGNQQIMTPPPSSEIRESPLLQTCWYCPAATVGQTSVLQSLKSDISPGQSNPPLAGAGLSHVRDLDHLPPPQVTVHVPH